MDIKKLGLPLPPPPPHPINDISIHAPLIEEIEIINHDVSGMPDCAEKVALVFIQNLLKCNIDGAANPINNKDLDDMQDNLKLQLEKQELSSQAVGRILIDIKIKTSISDKIIALRKLLKEIRPLDLQEIIRLVSKAAEGNSMISGQDIVLFIGETGTGKSTTIQFLAGCKMGEVSVEIAENKFIKHHIEAVSIPENNPSLIGVKSSCLNKSETRYIKPVIVNLKEVIGPQEDEYMNLCDAPGYGDTDGPEIDIANSLGIINGIKKAKSVKVVALLSSKGGDRGEGIRRLARLLVNLIEDFEERSKSILYLFTKYPRMYDANSNLIDLKNTILKNELEQDSGFTVVINDMIEKTEDETLVVNPIEDKPKKILKAIKKLKGIKNPERYFKYSLSEASNNSIKNQLIRDKDNIKCALKNKNSELTLFYLNNLKRLKDLINKDIIIEVYTDAVNLVSETLQNFINETKVKFNKALASQDGLKKQDIKEYKEALEYIKNSQIFDGHLDIKEISPNIFKQNLEIELKNIKIDLKDESSNENFSHNPFFGIYLDNILAISSLMPEFKNFYKAECEEILVLLNSFFQEIRKLVDENNLDEFSEKLLILYNSMNFFKNHEISKKIKQKYIEIIEAFLKNLGEFSNDTLFYNQKITRKEIQTLKNYLEKLKAAKESPMLQDRIAIYTRLIENDVSSSSEGIKNIKSLFSEFFKKINDYFDKLNSRIQNSLKERGGSALTEIEILLSDMDIIREIPEIELNTARKYYQTIESICEYTRDLQQLAERLLYEFDNNSKDIK